MPKRLATIDIGTNTTLLLVAEATETPAAGRTRVWTVAPLVERAEITRLGRGIGSGANGAGRLQPDKIAHTLEVLREYTEIAHRHDTRPLAVGTEALRRAKNARDFLGPAAAILGSPVEVIDGEREAALTFLATARSFPESVAGDAIVIDIGGGSTEIIFALAGAVSFRTSLPLGSVRLTEAFVHDDPPTAADLTALRAEIERQLADVPFPDWNMLGRGTDASRPTLIGTAGTVTTFAAMAQSLADYDASRVHGFRLSRSQLTEQIERLSRAPQAEREKMIGLDPRRADVILAGGCLLAAIVDRAGVEDILVSDRGVRWGLYFEMLDSLDDVTQPPGGTFQRR